MPADSNLLSDLLCELTEGKRLEELPNYKILELKLPSGQTSTIYYDITGENTFSKDGAKARMLRANESLEKPLEYFEDILWVEAQNLQDIVKNFLEFKEGINISNPNAKIEIIDDAIIISSANAEPIYFLIDRNTSKIVRAQAKEIPIPNFAGEPQEMTYFQSVENLPAAETQAITVAKIGSTVKSPFDEYLSNMSNFGQVINSGTQRQTVEDIREKE